MPKPVVDEVDEAEHSVEMTGGSSLLVLTCRTHMSCTVRK
jgi:hypothetical protein